MSTTQTPAPPSRKARFAESGGRSAEVGAREPRADGEASDEHVAIDLQVPPARRGWIIAVAVSATMLLAVLLLVGLLPRLRVNKELAADASDIANAPVPVTVVTPRRAAEVIDVRLPGTLRPWQEVSIFARVTGYLDKFLVDISNQVTKGQLLAKIDAPDVDAQLRGAKATLQQQQAAAKKAQTDFEFAQTTLNRYESLRNTNGVTKQELDTYRANYNSASATLKSANANVAVAEAEVKRLSDMQSFEQITAPFSGVVTGRSYDVGSMILANPTTTDTMPLFKIAENDVLRAFVYVPQNYSLTIQKGMDVQLTAREQPGRIFTGTVMGTTNYLDPTARSLMTEVKIPNADLALLPGMFVDVAFKVKRDHPPLIIPASALVAGPEGNQVGIVRDEKLHFQKVELGIDYGADNEIVSGLKGDEQVIVNPGGRTVEGAQVKVAAETRQESAND